MSDDLERLTNECAEARAALDDLWGDLRRIKGEMEANTAELVSTLATDRSDLLGRRRELRDALDMLPDVIGEQSRRAALADLALGAAQLSAAEAHYIATQAAYSSAGEQIAALRRAIASKQLIAAGGRPGNPYTTPYVRQDRAAERETATAAWHGAQNEMVTEAQELNRRIEAEFNPRGLQVAADLATSRLSAARIFGTRYGFAVTDGYWRNPASWPAAAHRAGEQARGEARRLVAGA